MSSLPQSGVIAINRGCRTDCQVCPPTEWAGLTAPQVDAALDELATQATQVYVGMEAFADLAALPHLLRACGERSLTPLLLTRGLFAEGAEELKAELRGLRQHGGYHILLALDHEHYAQMGLERLHWFLHACTVSMIHVEMLYLLKPGECLPSSFLEEEEVNKFATIHTKTADDLLTLFTGSIMAVAGVVQKPARPGGPARPRGGEPLAQYQPVPVLNSADEPVNSDYPISFRALVLETTYLCNAKCAHCYTTCGPEVSNERLSVEQAKRIIDEAADLPNIQKRCHIGGGEATIYWNELIEMLAHAKARGFVNSIVTNGWWGKDPDRALLKMIELKEAGVSIIEFSVSAFHREYISSQPVANIIRAAKQVGVSITLRISTTRTHRASEVMSHLDSESQRDIAINAARVTSMGRAKEAIPKEDLWTEPGIPLGACNSVLNITINAKGDVFPCCAGSENCPPLLLGNCLEQPLTDVVKSLRGNFLVRTLVHAGPAYYAALIAEAGLGHKLLPSYGTYCHLCTQIFTDEEMSAVVLQSVNQNVADILLSLAGLDSHRLAGDMELKS